MNITGAVVILPEKWGVGVCPTSDMAAKHWGLGALIKSPNDYRAAHDLAIQSNASTLRKRHPGPCKRLRGHAAVLALFNEVIAAA
jgi:hypothetical protein